MMERAVEKMRRDVLKHEMERKRNAEERNTRERFSQRDREEKYSASETISGVHYELPKEETEHIKRLFRKFDALYASANELQTRLRKSLCARRRDALKHSLVNYSYHSARSYTYSYLPHSLSSSFFYPFSPYFSITSFTRFSASSIESRSCRHSSSVNRMFVVAPPVPPILSRSVNTAFARAFPEEEAVGEGVFSFVCFQRARNGALVHRWMMMIGK